MLLLATATSATTSTSINITAATSATGTAITTTIAASTATAINFKSSQKSLSASRMSKWHGCNISEMKQGIILDAHCLMWSYLSTISYEILLWSLHIENFRFPLKRNVLFFIITKVTFRIKQRF